MNTTELYRYPGSRPFEDNEIERQLFFGRRVETQTLFHKILAEKLVILYAKSGMGKTSILNAGLMQLLRDKDILPLKIRFSNINIDCLHVVYEGIREAIKKTGIEFNPGNEKTLWQYFKTVEFWSSKDILLTPVLVLDQFEELFTLSHTYESRKRFITQLADLVRNRIPEEIGEEESIPYTETPPQVKIIISIREDFLGQLEEMSNEIPAIFSNRFRLTALNCDQAKVAIIKPAQFRYEQITSKPFEYDDRAVEAMLCFLCKGIEKENCGNKKDCEKEAYKREHSKAEPFQLQLLCQHIEKVMSEKQLKTVREEYLGGVKGMQNVFLNFYDDNIKNLKVSRRQEKKVRKLFDEGLIIKTGRRMSLDIEYIEQNYKVSKQIMDQLAQPRLLRYDPREGGKSYELSHDTLIRPVQISNQKYFRPRRIRNIIVILLFFYTLYMTGKGGLDNYGSIVYVYQGNISDLKNNKDEAFDKYNKAIDRDPTNADAYIKLAMLHLNAGNVQKSIEKLKEASNKNKENADTYLHLGIAYSKQEGATQDVIENCQKAIKYAEQDLKGIKILNIRYIKSFFKQIINKYLLGESGEYYVFNFAYAYYIMGNILSSQRSYGDAIDNYKNAIKYAEEDQKKPRDQRKYPNIDFVKVYSNLGNAQINTGYYNDAIVSFNEALKYDPKSVSAYKGLGYVYSGKDSNEYDKAIENYEKAIKYAHEDQNKYQQSDIADIYFNIGNAYSGKALATKKGFDKAIEYYQKALELKPEFSEARDNLENVKKALAHNMIKKRK